jgi:hypothetical protein
MEVFRRNGSLRSVAATVFVGKRVPVIGGGVVDPRKWMPVIGCTELGGRKGSRVSGGRVVFGERRCRESAVRSVICPSLHPSPAFLSNRETRDAAIVLPFTDAAATNFPHRFYRVRAAT